MDQYVSFHSVVKQGRRWQCISRFPYRLKLRREDIRMTRCHTTRSASQGVAENRRDQWRTHKPRSGEDTVCDCQTEFKVNITFLREHNQDGIEMIHVTLGTYKINWWSREGNFRTCWCHCCYQWSRRKRFLLYSYPASILELHLRHPVGPRSLLRWPKSGSHCGRILPHCYCIGCLTNSRSLRSAWRHVSATTKTRILRTRNTRTFWNVKDC